MIDFWTEVFKSNGMVGFIIMLVLVGAAWVLRTVVLHFMTEVREFRKTNTEMSRHFSDTIEKVSSSVQASADANLHLSNTVHQFAIHSQTFADRNLLEHKDIMQTQGQIIHMIKRNGTRKVQDA